MISITWFEYLKQSCEKWTDQHDTSVGQGKNLSSRQEFNQWPPEHRVGALSTELRELMEGKVIEMRSYMAGVLHTTNISTVEVIVSAIKEDGEFKAK